MQPRERGRHRIAALADRDGSLELSTRRVASSVVQRVSCGSSESASHSLAGTRRSARGRPMIARFKFTQQASSSSRFSSAPDTKGTPSAPNTTDLDI